MSKEPKHNRLKARLPRGLSDRSPAEIGATRRMLETIRGVYERYGFEPVETPAIEYTDALGKFLPDQDRPNEGVFSFQDDDEQWLSLRYDLTAPLARYVAENFDKLPKPYRSYRFGWVFRNEKPGPGRYRQFMQFDADTVGSASPAADAEICMMAADTMEALGIPRGSYVVKVNNRKILDGVLESIGLSGEANAYKRLTVLRAIDKYDRLGREGVKALLGEGRRDESGDFTKGAGLDEDQIRQVLGVVASSIEHLRPLDEAEDRPISDMKRSGNNFVDSTTMLEAWSRNIGSSNVGHTGITELQEIIRLCEGAGYGSNRICVDQSVVRGLEYYTGPVYEVELTFEIKDDDGRSVRFGSVAGGGRYDGLVARFRGEPVPATGFSIGVSRLAAALEHLGKLDTKAAAGPVVVTVFDRDRLADYQRMTQKLREAGIRAELYLGSGKMGPQLKYADKRNAPCVVIQGGDEKARGEVQIKDLIEGAKAAAAIASNQEWRETRPAQFAAKENKLVEAVRGLLIRHGITQNQRSAVEEDIKSAIRSNIGSLFDAAELLASKEYYGPAIHLMMAAREEGVKWILVYCWSHLDPSSRAKIFSHDFKHKTAGVFYFLSGQLQAIDFAVGGLELLKNEDPQVSEAAATLMDLLPKTIDTVESIAQSIVHALGVEPDEDKEIRLRREEATKKLVDDSEALRQNSIYVDFDRTLAISAQPASFGNEDYAKIKKDVLIARYHIDKLSGLNPSKDVLHSTFPEWKDDLEKSLRDLSSRLNEIRVKK